MDKRYYLFSGSEYYPSGGMSDFDISLNSIEEVKTEFEIMKQNDTYDDLNWAHIFDTETKQTVLYYTKDSWSQEQKNFWDD
jgi:hypothetical protein